MATYVEYELEDGGTVIVEVKEAEGGVVKASRDKEGNIIIKTGKKFREALASNVKPMAEALRQEFSELKADEVEVKFGLTATGELGNFAVGKIGVEANYEITLKWANK